MYSFYSKTSEVIMLKKKEMVQTSLYIPVEFKEEVERIAHKRDISQQKVYRMMLEVGLSFHKDMEKVGVIAAVDFVYYAKKSMKEILKSKKPIQLEII